MMSKISKLSKRNLDQKCVELGLDVSLPRLAKVNIVCLCLGISTSGGSILPFLPRLPTHVLSQEQTREYQTLTPPYVYTREEKDWSKNLELLPDVDDATVKKYLLDTDVLSKTDGRRYKLSRPYQMKSHIHSVRIHPLRTSSTFMIVKGLCNPSQSTNKDEVKAVYCIIDKISAQPYGGYCTCTAGLCQTCGHIGALLFAAAQYISTGEHCDGGVEPSCTDVMCKWTDPKGAAAAQKHLDNIKGQLDHKEMTRKATDFGQIVQGPNVEPPDIQAILQLRAGLFKATMDKGDFVPAVHALQPHRFRKDAQEKPFTTHILPDIVYENDHLLAPAFQITAKQYPLPIALLPRPSSEDSLLQCTINFMDQIVYSEDDRREIEKITRNQSDNIEWYKQRMGSITTTQVRDIVAWTEKGKINVHRLIEKSLSGFAQHLQHAPKPMNQATKYGLKKEPLARKAYVAHFAKSHVGVRVQETGLMVHPQYHYIRGSPDGIISCSCHAEKVLLEIKCPANASNLHPAEAIRQRIITWVIGGNLSLIPGESRGYYEQVQAGLAITGLQICHFIIWSPCGFICLVVPFDRFDSLYFRQGQCRI